MSDIAPDPQVVTREQWRQARLELLAKEKELSRHGDEIIIRPTRQR